MEEQNPNTVSAYDKLRSTLEEFNEIMDETQTMYHHLFVRSLFIKDSLRTTLKQLQEQEHGTV
ncbi:MAG: hypothetical protein FWE28_06940 [Oscillospiraceae bacterium]|nr:hypothetical protein [Oscillospiraceae bacterium]